MAGIVYRTCVFSDVIGVAVAEYQSTIKEKEKEALSYISDVRDTIAQMTDISDFYEVLDTYLAQYGTTRARLRVAVGLGVSLKSTDEREEWLLRNTGIAIVNGLYLAQAAPGPNAVAVVVSPYREAYNIIGLETLEATLAVASVNAEGAYSYFIKHDGILYTGTPKEVTQITGVSFSELDTVLFLWFGPPNRRVRSSLKAQGFPSNVLYSITKPRSIDNVTVLRLDRTDFVVQLRAMGFEDDSYFSAFFGREIENVLIDTSYRRADDTDDAFPGVLLAIPYPSELALALRLQVQNLPAGGAVRNDTTGARTFAPAGLVLSRTLDLGKSLDSSSIVRSTSDNKVPSDNETAQAFLSASDTSGSSTSSVFSAFAGNISDSFIEVGEALEDIRAALGIDASCGFSGLPSIDIDDLKQSLIDAAEADVMNMWNVLTSTTGFKIKIGSGTVSIADSLACASSQLSCTATSTLSDQGAEGGVYDEDGSTESAMSETDEVLKAIAAMSNAAYNDITSLYSSVRSTADAIATGPNGTCLTDGAAANLANTIAAEVL